MKFLKNVNSPDGRNLGYRHITVSTCGLTDKIDALANEGIPINLAISLHAPDDEKRRSLMPIAKAYPIDILMKSCDNYFEKTMKKFNIEKRIVQRVLERAIQDNIATDKETDILISRSIRKNNSEWVRNYFSNLRRIRQQNKEKENSD